MPLRSSSADRARPAVGFLPRPAVGFLPRPAVGFLSAGWHPEPGGVETHSRALARELARRGWRVEALAVDTVAERPAYDARDELVDAVRVRRVAYRYQDQRALADLVRRERAQEVVLAWARERALALVHVQHATGFGTGVLPALAAAGVPVVASLHDYWTICPRGQMWSVEGAVCERPVPSVCGRCLAATWPPLLPSGGGQPRGPRDEVLGDDASAAAARTAYALDCLAACAALIVPSRAAAQVLARGGVPAGRMQVLTNAVGAAGSERGAIDERRSGSDRGLPPASVVLGVLGSVQPSKGVLELAHGLIAAGAHAVLEVHGPRPTYHGDASYVRALEALAERDTSVRLFGAYAPDRLPQVLARLDALVVPSRWEEAFGLTAREALAAGLPVLAARRGGLAELAGRPGVRLAEASDEAGWARAIAGFLADLDGLRREAGASSPETTLGAYVDRLEAIYRKELARPCHAGSSSA